MRPIYDYNHILGERINFNSGSTTIVFNNKQLRFRHIILTSNRLLIFKNTLQVNPLKEILRMLFTENYNKIYRLEHELYIEDIVELKKPEDLSDNRHFKITHFTGDEFEFNGLTKLYLELKESIKELDDIETQNFQNSLHKFPLFSINL